MTFCKGKTLAIVTKKICDCWEFEGKEERIGESQGDFWRGKTILCDIVKVEAQHHMSVKTPQSSRAQRMNMNGCKFKKSLKSLENLRKKCSCDKRVEPYYKGRKHSHERGQGKLLALTLTGAGICKTKGTTTVLKHCTLGGKAVTHKCVG